MIHQKQEANKNNKVLTTLTKPNLIEDVLNESSPIKLESTYNGNLNDTLHLLNATKDSNENPLNALIQKHHTRRAQ